MNISTAKAMTKSFINMGVKRTPIIATDWEFILENESVYLVSDENNLKYYFSSLNTYSKMYLFGPFKHDITDNKLIEPVYYTSCGFVSEDDFFLAEDLISEINYFKIKDMENGKIYLSDKGKEYLFVEKEESLVILHGDDSNVLMKKNITEHHLLYDMSFDKFIRFSSINIIQELSKKLKDNYSFKHDLEYTFRNQNSILYIETINSFEKKIIKLDKIEKYLNRQSFYMPSFLDDIYTFIKSDEESYNISKDIDESSAFMKLSNELFRRSSFFFNMSSFDPEDWNSLHNVVSKSLKDIYTEDGEIHILNIIDFFNKVNNIVKVEHTSNFIVALLYVYERLGYSEYVLDKLSRFNFKDMSEYQGKIGLLRLKDDLIYFIQG